VCPSPDTGPGTGPEAVAAHLAVKDLSVRHAYDEPLALEAVTFAAPAGSRLAVVGPNGAGKSTLFQAMVGLVPATSGQVLVHGVPFGEHPDCVSYVPQREVVDWRFPATVLDVVLMGRYRRLGWLRRPGPADRQVAQAALERLDLAALAARPIGDLSGGQQQRVFLARALAQEPHILLMDEPFTGVDVTTHEVVLDVLDDLAARGVTVLVATHDLQLAAARFDRVLLLNRRQIAFGPPAAVFTPENLARAFGHRVLFLPDMVLVDSGIEAPTPLAPGAPGPAGTQRGA
jgi:ABC-type Mn2+/Zn2+ transport system ATPase subunit